MAFVNTIIKQVNRKRKEFPKRGDIDPKSLKILRNNMRMRSKETNKTTVVIDYGSSNEDQYPK